MKKINLQKIKICLLSLLTILCIGLLMNIVAYYVDDKPGIALFMGALTLVTTYFFYIWLERSNRVLVYLRYKRRKKKQERYLNSL